MADTAEREYLNAYLEHEDTLVLIYKNEAGRVFGQRVPAEWVSFCLREDVGPAVERMLKGSRFVRSMRPDGRWWRIQWAGRRVREDMTTHPESPLVKAGVRSYEADVKPVERWLVDKMPRIAKPRRCFVDIETDSRVPFSEKEEMRVICISVVGPDRKRTSAVIEEWTDEEEKKLLEWFWEEIRPFDQVCAWNGGDTRIRGDGFDFPVLFERSRLRRVRVEARRWLWLDQMAVLDRLNTAAKSGDEKRSMKLEDVGQSITGKGKLKTPDWVVERFGRKRLGEITYELWAAGGKFRDLLVDYCEEDTDLQWLIEEETGFIELFHTMTSACGIFADTAGLNPTHQVDGYLMRLGAERDYRFPTKQFMEKPPKFAGAYVMRPKVLSAEWRKAHGMDTGILENVHVFDFKSLYPSIIQTLNMSAETKRGTRLKDEPIPEGTCCAPGTNVCFDVTEQGLLTFAITELLRLRKKYTEEKNKCAPGTAEWHAWDRLSTAMKVMANSFFGVVSSFYSRHFDRQIGESITQTAQWLIRKTIEAAEAKTDWTSCVRAEGVYSDTDSGFLIGPSIDEFQAFVSWANKELYPRLMSEIGCRASTIKLNFEKTHERIIFTSAKRYIARYAQADGKPATEDSAPEVKGLEWRRGDANRIATEMQAWVIDLLVGRMKVATDGPVPTNDLERFHAIISRTRERVLDGELTVDEVCRSASLKGLNEYVVKRKKDGTFTEPPSHVQVAKLLAERGQDVRAGTRVEYVVTDASVSPAKVIPADDYTGAEADRYYLWESLVFPPTQRLLECAFPNHDWEQWLKVRPQKPRGRARVLEGQLALLGGELLDQKRSVRVSQGIRMATATAVRVR